MQIEGSNIVVTGGAHGIGRGLAERFAAEGAATVTVVDLDGDAAAAAAEAIGGIAARVDVSDGAEVAALVDRVEREAGPIDLFCSNAGILVIGNEQVEDDRWRHIFDVNVMAHVWAARSLVPLMVGRGNGYILFTASAAGMLTQIGSAPYSVTKHAALAFAEWLAITYGDQGLKVSALCPQAVATNMTAGIDGGGVAGVDGMLSPADVADAVVAGLDDESFLILPHPEVLEYFRRKAADYDRWLSGMRRLQARFFGTVQP